MNNFEYIALATKSERLKRQLYAALITAAQAAAKSGRWLVIKLLRSYQLLISPLLGQNCRFTPTCSEYMMDAVEKHGIFKGLGMGGQRLLKCHPFSKHSGVDFLE